MAKNKKKRMKQLGNQKLQVFGWTDLEMLLP